MIYDTGRRGAGHYQPGPHQPFKCLNPVDDPGHSGATRSVAAMMPEVQAILINSNSPKAFCAGGDIRYLYDSYQAGNTQYQDFFATEYKMLSTFA